MYTWHSISMLLIVKYKYSLTNFYALLKFYELCKNLIANYKSAQFLHSLGPRLIMFIIEKC